MTLIENDEQRALRDAVAQLGTKYGFLDYVLPRNRAGEPLDELW